MKKDNIAALAKHITQPLTHMRERQKSLAFMIDALDPTIRDKMRPSNNVRYLLGLYDELSTTIQILEMIKID